jgi:hypothetical protein
MTEEQERAYRWKTGWFMHELGKQLKMHVLVLTTAESYFQWFFATHSFRRCDRFVVAYACLFLAGKVQENFQSLWRILVEGSRLRNKMLQDGQKILERGTEEVSALRPPQMRMAGLGRDAPLSRLHAPPFCSTMLWLPKCSNVKPKFFTPYHFSFISPPRTSLASLRTRSYSRRPRRLGLKVRQAGSAGPQ